MDFIYFMKL